MLRKPDLYDKVIALRHKGFSYNNEILENVHVGNGTISRWCQDIQLTEEQKARLLEKKRNTLLIQNRVKEAIQSRQGAKRWAETQIKRVLQFEQLLLISGILLYWAEGTKLNDEQNGHKGVEFTNTDSRMIKIMMRFFREVLRIPENKFKIMVRMGRGGDVERAQKYWSQITLVPIENFYRPELFILSEKSRSLTKYPNGMCRVVIHDIFAARKLAAFIENFTKIFPFTGEQP